MKKAIQELQTKKIAELEKELATLRTEVAKLKVEKKAKPEKDTNLIQKKQTKIAQLLTVMNKQKKA